MVPLSIFIADPHGVSQLLFPCFKINLCTKVKWDTSASGFADDVNLLGDEIIIIKKNKETLIDGINEVGLEIIVEKT
jgi:hypothetical protein